MKIFRGLDLAIEKFSHWGLVISVALMLILTVLSIVLRWFNTTFMWIDPLVRHLVFLAAFLGGALATGRDEHIGIDVIPKILENKKMFALQRNFNRAIYLFSTFACIWLLISGYDFFKVEIQYGKHTFLGLHSAVLVGIIPVGFSMMAYRFFYKFLASTCSCDSSVEEA